MSVCARVYVCVCVCAMTNVVHVVNDEMGLGEVRHTYICMYTCINVYIVVAVGVLQGGGGGGGRRKYCTWFPQTIRGVPLCVNVCMCVCVFGGDRRA
jgi:hypothetical protein